MPARHAWSALVACGLIAGAVLAGAPAAAAAAPTAGRSATVAQYGPEPLQTMALLPADRPRSPLVILVHGGGWTAGYTSWVDPQAQALRAQGFAVVNVEYRKAGATRGAFPLEVADVQSATRWAVSHVGQLGGDRDNVTLVGGSSGAQLVAMAAQQLNRATPGVVDKVVTLSAPTDLPALVARADAGTLNTSFARNLYKALQCGPGTCGADAGSAWSPARQAAAPCARWLLLHSELDFVPRAQVELLGTALAGAGCPVTTTIVPGRAHSFAYWPYVEASIYDFIRSPVGVTQP